MNEEERDPRLWRLAKKRAGFKRHLATYFIVNCFLWILWYLNGGWYRMGNYTLMPWPLYVTLGWGIGLVFGYYSAYYGYKDKLEEKEYEKLRRQRDRKL